MRHIVARQQGLGKVRVNRLHAACGLRASGARRRGLQSNWVDTHVRMHLADIEESAASEIFWDRESSSQLRLVHVDSKGGGRENHR